MSTSTCIIAIIVISFCISALVGCYLYKALKDEFNERVSKLEARVPMLEKRSMHLEEIHLDHMGKYH